MVNVASNKNGVGYGTWVHIDGWSDKVLQYIGKTLEGGENQIQAVEQIELGSVGATATFV